MVKRRAWPNEGAIMGFPRSADHSQSGIDDNIAKPGENFDTAFADYCHYLENTYRATLNIHNRTLLPPRTTMPLPHYTTFTLAPIHSNQYAQRLTINHKPLNGLDSYLLTEFHDYLTHLQQSPETTPKVLVVSSADPEIWIHHLDLHIISSRYPMQNSEDPAEHLLHLLGNILHLFQTLPTIFIAEIDGLAVGGGVEFAVNMDLRFAGPGSRFGTPKVAGGIIHGGGLQRLVHLMGPGRAMEFTLSSQAISGSYANQVRLVNRYTDSPEHLREYVDELATRIATWPRQGIEATKKSVRERLEGEGSMEKDMQTLGRLAQTEIVQKALSRFIELGDGTDGDARRNEWELGLPDSCAEAWSRH